MKKEGEIANFRRWIKLMEGSKNEVLDALHFNRGLFWGIFIGLLASIWSTLFYQDVLFYLPNYWKKFIFLLLSSIIIGSIIILTSKKKGLEYNSKVLKIVIPKLNGHLLKIQGFKPKGGEMRLNEEEMEEIYGKNWRGKRDRRLKRKK
ncbi:MAG: hypothetical protein KAK00_09050 [Nanoarchaeota archaeon]|nr:hypothetical protein [Nanoarchaeota archaeon]